MNIANVTGNGLLSAGSSLLGGIFGAIGQRRANQMNMKINQMNNEFNERMLDKQLAFQNEMWEKTNEYNTAVNQRKRLEDAGLNPYMMMSGGNAGTASAMSGGSASAASPLAMQNVGNAALQGATQVGQFATGLGLASAEIANKQATTAGQILNNDWFVDKTLAQMSLWAAMTRDKDALANLNRQRYEFNLASWDAQLQQFETRNYLNQAMAAEAFANASYTHLKAVSQAWQNLALPTQLKLSILQGYANLDLTKTENRLKAAQVLKTDAETYGIKLNNQETEALLDDVIEYKKSQMRWQIDYNDTYTGKMKGINDSSGDVISNSTNWARGLYYTTGSVNNVLEGVLQLNDILDPRPESSGFNVKTPFGSFGYNQKRHR